MIGIRYLVRAGTVGAAALLGSLLLWTGSAAAAPYAPPTCPTVTYHSAPTLNAQAVCQNLGVTTSGTQPGTYLFLTPGGQNGDGAGIFTDNGTLVWWLNGIGPKDHDMSVQYFHGQPYIAVWSGIGAAGGAFGHGVVLLYNQHYQLAGRLAISGAYGARAIDLHEFQITPEGDALTGSYTYNWKFVGGHWEWVLGYLVEKWALVQNASGIQIGQLLFAWNAINDVPVSDSHEPSPARHAAVYDYFHGNGITEAPDGDLLVSARNTWGIYEINDRRGTPGFDHIYWQVGAIHDSTLAEPWCYQHDIAALGHATYSLYDDGGFGPGCVPGSTQHPARGLVFSVDTSHRPVQVHLIRSFTHTPAIYTGYTGSVQLLNNGDTLIDWANVPQITEYSSTGQVNMDLSMSYWSYRGFRFAWDGQPTQPPAVAAQHNGSGTTVWVSWNGTTETAAWQVLAGRDASHLAKVGGPVAKSGFETTIPLGAQYNTIEVQALNASGKVLGTSAPTSGG